MDSFAEIMKWVKDLGLPVVALFYLFKLYQNEMQQNTAREERYAKLMEGNSVASTQLTVAVQNMTTAMNRESELRQALLDKLVDRALARQVGEQARRMREGG